MDRILRRPTILPPGVYTLVSSLLRKVGRTCDLHLPFRIRVQNKSIPSRIMLYGKGERSLRVYLISLTSCFELLKGRLSLVRPT